MVPGSLTALPFSLPQSRMSWSTCLIPRRTGSLLAIRGSTPIRWLSITWHLDRLWILDRGPKLIIIILPSFPGERWSCLRRRWNKWRVRFWRRWIWRSTTWSNSLWRSDHQCRWEFWHCGLVLWCGWLRKWHLVWAPPIAEACCEVGDKRRMYFLSEFW